VIFGSEIKAILAHPTVHAELDLDSLSVYFAFGYIPGSRTLFKGVDKLLPGEGLRWEVPGRPETRKYWHLPPIVDDTEDEVYCVRHLRELFLKGLERCVNGCRDVGVFLSGGVDSSIIVAGLRELGVPRVSTFTVGFKVDGSEPQAEGDVSYARLVAERFGTKHHEVLIQTGVSPEARLLRVIKQFDDLIMTPNTYSKYLLAEAVREAGLNSVLTGSGNPAPVGSFRSPERRAKWEAKLRKCTTNEEKFYKSRSRLFDPAVQKRILHQSPRIGKKEILDLLHSYVRDTGHGDFERVNKVLVSMITHTEKSLGVLDRACMLASVEPRSPYRDRDLFEFSTRPSFSPDGGKTYMSPKTHLKKAWEQSMPQPLLERRGMGYPSYYWNNGELAPYQELLSRKTIVQNGVFKYKGMSHVREQEKSSEAKSVGKMSWALTQFCLWYEIHIKRNPMVLHDAESLLQRALRP
jgi:asparagine synthase (glutamine-hydrolysing)